MKRQIHTHEVNGLNEVLKINVLDNPGNGGACHVYQIEPVETANESNPSAASRLSQAVCRVKFQDGPILESGVNGISNESLLAIVRDRLECFQAGDFACDENQAALDGVVAAMDALLSRTAKRVIRGVEGQNII